MTREPTSQQAIQIRGASQNNLKKVDVEIPAQSLTVITGVSGSGKSSLAFDTLYAEGQRRYVESMSAYARQFLERINKPAVQEIRGICPAISIRQKNTSHNPRSTVGTVTEIYDFMRLLWARAGTVRCRDCDKEVEQNTVEKVVDELLLLPAGTRVYIAFPFENSALDLNAGRGEAPVSLEELTENLVKQGFFRLFSGGPADAQFLQLPTERPKSLAHLDRMHVLVDRLIVDGDMRERLSDSIGLCFREGNGIGEVTVQPRGCPGADSECRRYSERFECQHCGIAYRQPEPRLFSFNNPYGACPTCHGFGNTVNIDRDLVIPDPSRSLADGAIDPFNKPRYRRFQNKLIDYADRHGIPTDVAYEELSEKTRRKIWNGDRTYPGVKGLFETLGRKKYKMHVRIFISRYRGYALCSDCEGERLREEARDVTLGGRRISELTKQPVSESLKFFQTLELSPEQEQVAGKIRAEICKRLEFLVKVGLCYLTLDRVTGTLSGGEMQRIHLSASLGSSLVGTLYVLDEPSVGLHARDQDRLIRILEDLRDLGNTIVVVEHEQAIMEASNYLIDMGPGAGELGGEVSYQGPVERLHRSESLTGKYLRGDLRIPVPVFRRRPKNGELVIRGARQHNLKNIDIAIPLGVLICVTGVSGSGKSTLVHDVLYAGIKKQRGDWKGSVGACDQIEGADQLSDILLVDQAAIGKTPRSNPVTYIKAYDEIRKLFASLRAAQALNLGPGHFSFNVSGGRCETCKGSGTVTVDMQFLADVELVCEDCRGTRFQRKVLSVQYKGKNIDEVLNLTVDEAVRLFEAQTTLVRRLKVLQGVGLGYIRLGQSATTLSGGEAQRIKLASYLAKKTAQHPLFIFDEPSTGLHFDDIAKLLRAFDRLLSRGASVIVVEHNLDIIKSADWIIDLGPEGGEDGGRVVAEGVPEDLVAQWDSHTARFLRPYLEAPRGHR